MDSDIRYLIMADQTYHVEGYGYNGEEQERVFIKEFNDIEDAIECHKRYSKKLPGFYIEMTYTQEQLKAHKRFISSSCIWQDLAREDELSGTRHIVYLKKLGKTDKEILDIYLDDPKMMESLGIGKNDRCGLIDIIEAD